MSGVITVVSTINPRLHKSFQRDKLFLSIYEVVKHRKTSQNDATALTDTVIQLILGLQEAKVSKLEITKTTHEVLSRFDELSAMQYKALHTTNE